MDLEFLKRNDIGAILSTDKCSIIVIEFDKLLETANESDLKYIENHILHTISMKIEDLMRKRPNMIFTVKIKDDWWHFLASWGEL